MKSEANTRANLVGDPTNQPSIQSQSPSRVCRFYNTSKGCRAGSNCQYRHDQPKTEHLHDDQVQDGGHVKDDTEQAARTTAKADLQRSQRTASAGPAPKPVPLFQQKNPREFEINQVIRRFLPVRKDGHDETTLSFSLKPSDPDFPFELEGLHCHLSIPRQYPQNGKPSLRVRNTEMERGYQINVERGFDSLLEQRPKKTLLRLLNDLDRNLEAFLIAEKAQTIKIIPNASRKEDVPLVEQEPITSLPLPNIASAVPLAPIWTNQQKSAAVAKRHADVRQLVARMGRVQGFSQSEDGTAFNVPVQIPKPGRLPLELQSLKEITLNVPQLYNLEPCSLQLKGVHGSTGEKVTIAFERHTREYGGKTLMEHINYLTQNIHLLSAEDAIVPTITEIVTDPPSTSELESKNDVQQIVDAERPHLRVISRPPEWDHPDSATDSDSEDHDSEEYTSSSAEEADGGAVLPSSSSPATSRGILLSFPSLELHNIELLDLVTLSLSLKCLRCKSNLDVIGIRPSTGQSSAIRSDTCPKCASEISVSFVTEPLHANTIRAGSLDVLGATITDMLPSQFAPTCANCSNLSKEHMISVRGESPLAICRTCHSRMSFATPEVKFLRVSHPSKSLPMRKPKTEKLGVVAGTPLPLNGACEHYKKSYRWFRFSCCNRVYRCDRCHDANESHPNEHADRMICGFCSREQRYRPEECSFCGKAVIRKKGGGFWEGGKGTRDRTLMNRKDPRKHKRIGGQGKKE